MTWKEVVDLAKEIGTALGLISAALVVIYGGINSYIKTSADASESKARSASMDVDTMAKKRMNEMDLAKKTSEISSQIIDDLQRRFEKLSEDLFEANQELERFKQLYKISEIHTSRYRDLGLRMVGMIQRGIEIRNIQVSRNSSDQCNVCAAHDKGTLKILAEIERIFLIEWEDIEKIHPPTKIPGQQ